jgi:hypothetical protein
MAVTAHVHDAWTHGQDIKEDHSLGQSRTLDIERKTRGRTRSPYANNRAYANNLVEVTCDLLWFGRVLCSFLIVLNPFQRLAR